MAGPTGIKGFAITPVLLGRIGIGELVEYDDQRLPRRLDHIVITGMAEVGGAWAEHPEMAKLLEAEKAANPDKYKDGATVKLHSIPVRILFDSPENNFRAEYTCFDNKGRPLCAGDGAKAKRRNPDAAGGIESVECPGAELCAYGGEHSCKQFGRLIVGMESLFESDPLSGFMFRTTGLNSIRYLTARLQYFAALTGNKMAGMPCNLRIRAKSTAASSHKIYYYIDLEPSGGLIEAFLKATAWRKKVTDAGMDYDALDIAVSNGIKQSAFFECAEDGEEVREEFMATTTFDEGLAQHDAPPAATIVATSTAKEQVDAAPSSCGDKGDSGSHKEAGSRVGEPCLPSQVRQIEALLEHDEDRSMATTELFKMLELPVSTSLQSLLMVEAADAIQFLMLRTKKQSRSNASRSVSLDNIAVVSVKLTSPSGPLVAPKAGSGAKVGTEQLF